MRSFLCTAHALVQLFAYAIVGSAVLALVLGKMLPDEPEPQPERRFCQLSRYVPVNIRRVPITSSDVQIFDIETGCTCSLALAQGERLELTSVSPWRDEQGEVQLVGRWSRLTGGWQAKLTSVGLGRFAFPSGRPLDRVEIDILPTSPPCWYPGTGAKVLFAAGDGRLYSFSFDGLASTKSAKSRLYCEPIPISWCTKPPGEGPVFLCNPFWPTDQRLRGKLLVSLRLQQRVEGQLRYSSPRLWWLELDAEGAAIVAAGPLIDRDEDGDGTSRQFPLAAAAPDGTLLLAHLWKPRMFSRWSLAVAPISLGPCGEPRCTLNERTRDQDGEFLPAGLVVSADGSRIYGHAAEGPEDLRCVFLAVSPRPELDILLSANRSFRGAAGGSHRR
jgi:hypothetical protein